MARLTVVSMPGRENVGEVEMPDATSMGYAAKRVAEFVGIDPDLKGLVLIDLVHMGGRSHIDPTDVAKKWDGKRVVLGMDL